MSSAAPASTAAPPTHRRRRASLVVVIVALIVLLSGAFVAADRLALGYAERAVGSGVADQLGLSTPPQVEIRGFPFLTQLLARRYTHIELTAADLTLGTAPALTVSRCRLVLDDVTVADGSYRVASLTGSASLPWDQLAALTGQQIDFDPATGRASVMVRADVLGTTVTVTLSGKPALDVQQQRIVFNDGEIVLAGTALPKAVAAALISQFLKPIPLDLPYDIRASALHLDAAGLELDLAGEDISIPR